MIEEEYVCERSGRADERKEGLPEKYQTRRCQDTIATTTRY